MKRILQLDGGGLRGVIPLVLLERIENITNKKINQIFQLFSGTSTGAIICSCLAAGVPAKEVLSIYLTRSKVLFEKNNIVERYFTKGAKYNRQPLRDTLNNFLVCRGVKVMRDFPVPLAITAFGKVAGRTHYINSWASQHQDLNAVDVISWSALSAAFYFGKINSPMFTWEDKYQVSNVAIRRGEVFQDGGQGTHNCTAEDSLRVARYSLNWKNEEIRLLSLGCGGAQLMAKDYTTVANDNWITQSKDYLFQARPESTFDQISNASFIQEKTYGDLDHFKRIDCIIPDKLDTLDGLDYIEEYCAIGHRLIQQIPSWILK